MAYGPYQKLRIWLCSSGSFAAKNLVLTHPLKAGQFKLPAPQVKLEGQTARAPRIALQKASYFRAT
jgi:hypothetical protein